MSFALKVRHPNGEVSATVTRDTTVAELKETVGAQLDPAVAPDRIRLIYLGRVMTPISSTIGQYNLSEGQTVHMVIRPLDAPQQTTRPQPSVETDRPPQPGGGAPGVPPDATGGADPNAVPGEAFGAMFRGIFQNIAPGLAPAFGAMNRAAAGQAAPTGGAQPPNAPAPTATGPAAGAPGRATPTASGQPAAQPPQPEVRVHQVPGHFHVHHPQPNLAAYHVHLHVTAAELETLPDRIATFQQRMTASAGPATHVHVQHLHQQQQPTATSMAEEAARAAQNPNPATARPASVESLADVDRLLRAPSGAGSKTLVEAVRPSLEGIGIAEAMPLLQGDWSVFTRLQQPLIDAVEARLGRYVTDLLLRETVEESVMDVMREVEADGTLRTCLTQRARNPAEVYPVIRSAIRTMATSTVQLARQFAAPAARSAFVQNLRVNVIRCVGMYLHHAEQQLLRNGESDLTALIQAMLGVVGQTVARRRPEMAMLATTMLPSMGVSVLLGWKQEYLRNLRSPADPGQIAAGTRVVIPVSTRTNRSVASASHPSPAAAGGSGPSTPAAAAAAAPSTVSPAAAPRAPGTVQADEPASADLDAMLNDALESTTAPANAAVGSRPAAAERLNAALLEAGYDAESAADAAETLSRDMQVPFAPLPESYRFAG